MDNNKKQISLLKQEYVKVNGTKHNNLLKVYVPNTEVIKNSKYQKKLAFRKAIQEQVTEDESVYDSEDLMADMAKVLLDVLDGKSTSPAIQKFRARQDKIRKILENY